MKRFLLVALLSVGLSCAETDDSGYQKNIAEYNEKKEQVYKLLIEAQEKLATSSKILEEYQMGYEYHGAAKELNRELTSLKKRAEEIIGPPLQSHFRTCYGTMHMISNQYNARFAMVRKIYEAQVLGQQDEKILAAIGSEYENWILYRDLYDKDLPYCLQEIYEVPKDKSNLVIISPEI